MIDNDVPQTAGPGDKAERRPVRKAVKHAASASAPTKSQQIAKLLRRPRGATISELCTATSWQPHSVRALLSGMRKNGVRLVREARKSGEGSYRIAMADVASEELGATAATNEAA